MVKDKGRTPLIHSVKFPSALTYRRLALISHYLKLGVEDSMLGALKNQIPLSDRIRKHFAHGFPSEGRHVRVRLEDERRKAFKQPLERSYCQQCTQRQKKESALSRASTSWLSSATSIDR